MQHSFRQSIFDAGEFNIMSIREYLSNRLLAKTAKNGNKNNERFKIEISKYFEIMPFKTPSFVLKDK